MSGAARPAVVALAGNPNCGKTTLFNRLTGLRQRVGNYPGVTVERRAGRASPGGRDAEVIDLPGTYSLISRSRDEAIAFEVLTGRGADAAPDLAVLVLDASNLDRNLYLALSVLELGRPALVALNMMDLARDAGLEVDPAALAEALGVPVVPIVARTGEGLDALEAAIATRLAEPPAPAARAWRLDAADEASIGRVRDALPAGPGADGEAVWLLSSLAATPAGGGGDAPADHLAGLDAARRAARAELDRAKEGLGARVIEARYAVATAHAEASTRRREAAPSPTDRLDAVLLHPVLGLAVMLAVMAALFQSLFSWAEPLMGLIEGAVAAAQGALRAALPGGALADLLVDGVIGGVGNVIVFVPQIAILFAFLAVLEDSGYLARAAFLSDRLMARIGLHGRAFVPLISGFACAIPAVMATRAIESTRDRLVTLLVAPLVSCSARLPIYTLIIATLFAADEQVLGVFSKGGLLMLAMYALSVGATIGVAFVLKRTILRSPTPPLVLELPPYRWPEAGSVGRRVLERCGVFVRDAGTTILVCSMVLWALLYFPREVPLSFDPVRERASIEQAFAASMVKQRDPGTAAKLEERRAGALERIDARVSAERLAGSFAGRIGRAIEPLVAPLGFDWKIGIGLLGSFAAREVFVSTLGLVYGVGDGADEASEPLRERLRAERDPATGRPVYTPLVGLSLMVFFVLAAQCMSTVGVVRRETGGWRWPAFMVGYMTALAWLGAFAVRQGGRLLGFE
jgi:ferrous iron transport protein B